MLLVCRRSDFPKVWKVHKQKNKQNPRSRRLRLSEGFSFWKNNLGTKTLSQKLSISGVDPLSLYGHNDANLLALEARYGVRLTARGDQLNVHGPTHKVQHVSGLLEEMISCLKRGDQFDPLHLMVPPISNDGSGMGEFAQVILSTPQIIVRPRSQTQVNYAAAIQKHDIVFGIGPAGTGKTYLAVAAAVDALRRKEVSRIILTRPAVEAGETLGFLPGDIQDKVDPYLRPLYDALGDMLPDSQLRHLVEMRTLEIAPLAFMRGRTLNNAFVILDEAQNTTVNQMKMFLTRVGNNAKAVITGDITQIDLPLETVSGLVHVQHILSHIEAIGFVNFTQHDVVRHPLVQKIIHAYEQHNHREPQRAGFDSTKGDQT
jgi:phosphate starvation-inducible PhoH-like protein